MSGVWKRTFGLTASAFTLLAGCATPAPRELLDARLAYGVAAQSQTRALAPVAMQEAQSALERAEAEATRNERESEVRELAYVAQRRVWIAESQARLELLRREIDRANAHAREALLKRRIAPQQVSTPPPVVMQPPQPPAEQSKSTLVVIDRDGQQGRSVATEPSYLADRERQLDVEQRVSVERERDLERRELADSEERAQSIERQTQGALADVRRLGSVTQDARGLVLTLPGSVLFVSGSAALLPSARAQLGQLADDLLRMPEQQVTIEGHADSRGSPEHNEDLSYHRAESVRDELASRGVAPERVRALGFGARRPVADNRTPDGRALNRRVEIVLSPMHGTGGSGP